MKDELSSLGGRCGPKAMANRRMQEAYECAPGTKCQGIDACGGGTDPNIVAVGSCCGYNACYGISGE